MSRQGYGNVYLLTDGLQGFMERCLKPVSLRIRTLNPGGCGPGQGLAGLFQSGGGRLGQRRRPRDPLPGPTNCPPALPGLVEPDWLARHLDQPWLKVIDLRGQPEYNSGHIPGSNLD